MTFYDFCKHLVIIEKLSSRLEIRSEVSKLFASLSITEASIASYFLLGRLTPTFVPLEFGVSHKTLRIIVQNYGDLSDRQFTELLKKSGDIGDLILLLPVRKSSSKKSIYEIYENLWQMIVYEGKGSMVQKINHLQQLGQQVTVIEFKYILRLVLGKMRLGASDKTILDALSFAHHGDITDRKILEEAYGKCSDLGFVAQVYKEKGATGLIEITITPGVPLSPQLVERESTFKKLWARIDKPLVQPKYDGMRCQVHVYSDLREQNMKKRIWWQFFINAKPIKQASLLDYKQKIPIKVELFSRNLEPLTAMFPEVVAYFTKYCCQNKINSAILDSEVIGYNEQTEEYMLFQHTMKRRRKYNIAENANQVPVKIFAFDLLYLNKENLLAKPLCKRLKILKSKFNPVSKMDVLRLTPVFKPVNVQSLQDDFHQAIGQGLEGVIMKDPQSPYLPGVRNFSWLKYKKAMHTGLADTIDVVILGYYFGLGRLSKIGIGALLTGIYDRKTDQYLTTCKIGTGVTEEQWILLKKFCNEHKSIKPSSQVVVPKDLIPDVWVDPAVVVEVEADEITKSPTHSAGYALRFPRFVRVREKQPTDSTSLEEVKGLAKVCER